MKKLNLLLAGLCLAVIFPIQAQISQGGKPMAQARALSLENVPVAQLPTFNLESVMLEDAQDEKAGNYPKIGRIRSVDVTPHEFGEWTNLDEGGRIWRAGVKSRDAHGLSVQFEDFNLPEGARMFIYSADYKHIIGAFTSFNNHESGIFSTQLIPADEVIIEYFEPQETQDQPFRITGVLHAYRMVPGAESISREFGDSDSCQININCSEGNNWQDEKRGVARILVFEGNEAGWCTGSLVNNTAQDCTPYFLTALHCGVSASVSNMNQWIFYFNYESAGCSNGTSGQVPNNTMTGCARIADSGDGGGDSGSDYLLVEINNDVPQSYNPYFNGWRRNNVTSASGVSIHHPSGDIKKISTYTSSLSSVSWGGPSGTHWMVQWSATSNGHGVTEGGSSGSPIFDNQGLIIGTLTGGSSYCFATSSPDLYGKMSYHWASNPGDNLSDYLDPVNSGVTSLTGTNQPCGTVSEDCIADIPYSMEDECVITVIAADDFCCETEWDDFCESAYQSCTSGEVICSAGSVSVAASQNICPGETGIFDATGVSIPDGGGFAVQFTPDGGTGGLPQGFSILGVEPLPFEFDADINGIMSDNELLPLSGQWTVIGYVYTNPDNAAQTFCSVSDIEISLNFLSAGDPECDGAGVGNDDCADATSVVPGTYDFSTLGATTDGPDQPGSPCDQFEESNVNNDVWFEYTATCDGAATFSTCGTADFDTRIAVYPGGQCPPSAESLIVCNDDFGDCAGFTSQLEWLVTEGSTYLLRIGGYDSSESGEGSFELTEECGGTVGECIAENPYSDDDPCMLAVIAGDDYCCETEWDEFCEADYADCMGMSDCEAGVVISALSQNICPDETGIYDATDVVIPDGGGYAVQFLPDGGTGGNGTGFSITGVEPLPFEFDADINGIMSGNSFPLLSGQWIATGYVYTDPDDAAGTVCSISEVEVVLNFLSAGDPACEGGVVTNNESFEGAFPPPCWTMADTDDDGENWFKYGATNPESPVFGVAQDGFFTAASASYSGVALTPDNFLITPQLSLGSDEELVYWVAGQDPDWAEEHYGVFLSTTGNSPEDFTVNLFEETLEDDTWLERTIDLSAYAGQEVYLAFRHFDVTDMFYMKIDNVALPGEIIPCDEVPDEECTDFASGPWGDFTNYFEGAPVDDGEGCPFNEIQDFEVWMSEAYVMENVVEGTSYTFSHCNGPGAGSWIPEYTIIAPSGNIDAFGAGDGDGCSITWIATESGTYLIGINEAGNCGVGAGVDNGFPAITCNSDVTAVEESTGQMFSLFPNPNNGQFTLTYRGEAGLADIEVLEVSGKIVSHHQVNLNNDAVLPIDLGDQASGMYYVRVTLNSSVTVQKVMVQ